MVINDLQRANIPINVEGKNKEIHAVSMDGYTLHIQHTLKKKEEYNTSISNNNLKYELL